jgi:RNA polymerase sigma-70 factor, ECF subfamily
MSEREQVIESDFIARFHRGERDALARCYEEGFTAVDAAVGRFVQGADRETLVHEVFAKLIAEQGAREGFSGGSMRAWLATIGRNRAIDFVRRRTREDLVDPGTAADLAGGVDAPDPWQAEARALVDRFRRERLPEKWRRVFEARFLRQLSQREAARALGITRTTLAYQELRVRALLRDFFLGWGER